MFWNVSYKRKNKERLIPKRIQWYYLYKNFLFVHGFHNFSHIRALFLQQLQLLPKHSDWRERLVLKNLFNPQKYNLYSNKHFYQESWIKYNCLITFSIKFISLSLKTSQILGFLRYNKLWKKYYIKLHFNLILHKKIN